MVEHLQRSGKIEAYVVDTDRNLCGVINILRALGSSNDQAGALISPKYQVINLQDDLQKALTVARDFVGEAIPVVDEDGMFVGCISEGAILGGTLDRQEEVKGRERN